MRHHRPARSLPKSQPTAAAAPRAAPVRRLASRWAGLVAALLWTPIASAGDLVFGPPQFLPGDSALVAAAGHQEEMEIAAGGGGALAVWSDSRSSLDEFQGLEGSGYDIYAARLDGAGNVLDTVVIDEGPGNQSKPHVAWNGANWLVAWMEPKPTGSPTYERIRGVRVAPNGTVLDPEPILIHQEAWGCYCDFFGLAITGGGPDGWVVVFNANVEGLRAVRVQADGSVANPGGLLVNSSLSGLAYDIVFAQDEYMIVYSDGTQGAARRYSPTLQFLGSTPIPFGREVATDGTNFLVVGQSDSSWPPKLEALLLAHNGLYLVPQFTVMQGTNQSSPSGEGAGFDGLNYWVTWGGNQAARVSPAGVLLDPVGGFTLPLATQGVSWPAYDTAPGGGLQYLWHDGLGGAGYPRDVYTARITPNAQVLGTKPVSISAPAQVEPKVAEGAGIHMIVFRSRSSDAARILAQRIDDNGLALDPEPIEVASGPVQWLAAPSLDAPQVAWNGSVFMVTWSDTINVLARRMNPDGTFVDTTPLVIMPGRSTAVGALGTTFLVGGSEVVYFSGTLKPPGAFRVARVDGVTGAVLDNPPIMVGGASDRHPHIVTLGGRWLVVWESVTYDPWSSSVFYAAGVVFVAADGTTTGQLATGLSRRPNVAVAGDRALLVAVDHSVPGGTTDLEARILMADGTFLGPKFQLSTAPWNQLKPAATWDGTQFVVAWEDRRNAVSYLDSRTDIYGTRVTATGIVQGSAGDPITARPETEIAPALMTVGGKVLLAASTLRSQDPTTKSFRLGIQVREEGPSTYCTSKVNSDGCAPSLLWSGANPPSAGAFTEGFSVVALKVVAKRPGIFFYSRTGPAATPFMGGWLCTAGATRRAWVDQSGGSGSCGGALSIDFNAYVAATGGFAAGDPIWGQWWYRDPASLPHMSCTTKAIHFTLGQ